jgi:HSP20 family protein
VDLPGVGREDVTLTLHDGILELTGERNWKAPKDWKPISGDHEAFAYRLKLMVGDRVAEGGISAETSNGVLRLTLPKEEEQKPRKIEIS